MKIRWAILISALIPIAAARAEDRWEAAIQPRAFRFPQDHAAHEDYRIEWWYYTGNLQTSDGRRFGYQLTFFRTGVVRQPQNPSRWAVRDLYTTHFAISDVQARDFHFFERVGRKGVGTAGAATNAYHAWNGDWEVRLDGDRHLLVAEHDGCRLQLQLTSAKPPVLHGQAGLSRKGPSEGNASYYYSLTRMPTTGTLTLEGRQFAVSGLSWMDHEFSTSFLEKGQQGWDWFAIQLDDKRELMIYQIRRTDGKADPSSSGTLVAADGKPKHLDHSAFTLVPGDRWRSDTSGGSYPIAWTVRVPEEHLELSVRASMPNQEMNTIASTGIAYWEGSIQVEGRAGSQPVRGQGYLEMTGYAGKSLGTLVP